MGATPFGEPPRAGRGPYALDYDRALLEYFKSRTLAVCAVGLLPLLRPGMAVLDVGCGTGTLTVELAHHVAPGDVVGLDRAAAQFEHGRALAAERGVRNVRFEEGDVYALPFPDCSLDVVFSHALVGHLADPPRAFAEMRRVLRPGGIVAVSENDTATAVASPEGSAIARALELMWRAQAHLGGLSFAARHLRSALLAAGFERAEVHAAAEGVGTPEQVRLFAGAVAAILARATAARATVLEQGWATADELEALPAMLYAWGERPDAFTAGLKCCALGWKPADRVRAQRVSTG